MIHLPYEPSWDDRFNYLYDTEEQTECEALERALDRLEREQDRQEDI